VAADLGKVVAFGIKEDMKKIALGRGSVGKKHLASKTSQERAPGGGVVPLKVFFNLQIEPMLFHALL